MNNDTTYYILSPWDLLGGQYVHVDSNYVHYFDIESQKDVSVLSLKGYEGDYREFQFGAYHRSWIDKIDTVKLFGSSTRCIHFVVDGLVWVEVSLSEKYGMYYSFSPGEPANCDDVTNLRYCQVNGMSYGNSVSIKKSDKTAQTFLLNQNYPNPFNPLTTITYSVLKTCFVKIMLSDILGRKIKTLVDEKNIKGKHTSNISDTTFSEGQVLLESDIYVDRNFEYAVKLDSSSLNLFDVTNETILKSWDVSGLNYCFNPLIDCPDIYFHNTTIITAIKNKVPIPKEVLLLKAYPNPFNSSIIFQFKIHYIEKPKLKYSISVED